VLNGHFEVVDLECAFRNMVRAGTLCSCGYLRLSYRLLCVMLAIVFAIMCLLCPAVNVVWIILVTYACCTVGPAMLDGVLCLKNNDFGQVVNISGLMCLYHCFLALEFYIQVVQIS